MTDKSRIKIFNRGEEYTLPVVTGPHKGGTATYTNLPKLRSKITIESTLDTNKASSNFRSAKKAGSVYKQLTGVNVSGLPNLTKGQSCKCASRSKPVPVTNYRESKSGKEHLMCLRCGSKVK